MVEYVFNTLITKLLCKLEESINFKGQKLKNSAKLYLRIRTVIEFTNVSAKTQILNGLQRKQNRM